jgi:nucleoside-diphosphate-sugar epimerase
VHVLIVGCGYVGWPLGAALAAEGHQVSGLRRAGWGPAGPQAEAAGIRPLSGDITRSEDLARLPAGYDWVVHCVSSTGGGPQEYRSLYAHGTRNLLEWLAARPPGKFLYTSSTSVYGQNDGSMVDESAPTEPTDEKARILVETEGMVLEAARHRGFPGMVARLAGIYGPGRGYWFKQVISSQARIEDAGGRILNLVHRDDVVGAVIAILEQGRPGQVYNVVDDEPVTQRGFVEWLSNALGRPLPGPATGPPRERAPTNKRVSNAKLKTELGYRFQYPTFRQGYRAGLGTVG